MRLPLKRRAAQPAGEDSVEQDGGFLRLILTVLLLAWVIRSFLVAPFSIPSGSMLPALYIGDYVMVAKWPYGYSRYSFPWQIPSFQGRLFSDLPERGDVVVFNAPGANVDFIKRVVGLPGDRIAVQGGMLVINGRGITREPVGFVEIPITANSECRVVPGATPQVTADGRFCLYPAYRETLPGGRSYLVLDQVDNPRSDELPPTVVPEGHVFLMGDNRDDSLDSRFSPIEGGIGFVPVENLIGRGMFTFWSTDGSAEYLKPWTWFSALRSDRIGPLSSAEAQR